MPALNKQITINPDAFEKRFNSTITMSPSLQDAYNDILSNFSEAKIDEKYNDEMHQFLKNDKGDIYYFDDFNYIYPIQVSKDSTARLINTGTGKEFTCVRYNGLSIIVEDYNIEGVAEIKSYFPTDESREFLETDYKMGDFLLQISARNTYYINKLSFGSKITVRQENGNLVSYDINGNVIDTVPSNADTIYSLTPKGISFYKELESKVNYYDLLDRTYSISQESNSKENKKPKI